MSATLDLKGLVGRIAASDIMLVARTPGLGFGFQIHLLFGENVEMWAVYERHPGLYLEAEKIGDRPVTEDDKR